MFVRLNTSCRYADPSGSVKTGKENQVVEVDEQTFAELSSAGRIKKVEIALVVEEPVETKPTRRRKRK